MYDYINQDHLFAPTDNNDSTLSEEAPAFLDMVLTANDNNDDDEAPESEPKDMDNDNQEPLPRGFDDNNPTKILAMAINQAALARTSTEAGAESWFESVRAKLKICGISTPTKYQELFGASVVGSNPTKYSMAQDINNLIRNNHFQPMMSSTLHTINDSINALLVKRAPVQHIVFPGLPEDEQPLTGFETLTDHQLDCYTVILVLAFKAQRLCPFHWANKSFEKARTIGLDSWYHMRLSIKTRSWNTVLNSYGLPTLHKPSLQILLRTFHEGLPHRTWEQSQGNRLHQNMAFGCKAATKKDTKLSLMSIHCFYIQ